MKVIGITIGDPAGIGPEVSVKALDYVSDSVIPVLIGRREIIDLYFPGKSGEFEIVDNPESFIPVRGKKYIFHIPVNQPLPVPGKGSILTGIESKVYIDRALELWRLGKIDALATAPVSKGFIEKSGVKFTGHTEYLAAYLNEDNPFMMMYSQKYRVLLATTHIPVSMISSSLDRDRVELLIETAHSAMELIDRGNVKIAVAGLDPHCGDSGSTGTFDRDVTLPAIEKARKRGIDVNGPYSADTLFMSENWEKYTIVTAFYHDQGLIPFKMLAFDTGVNVTLGLSLTRTSADHGTAYDIAGRNIARYTSMAEAVNLAAILEGKRKNR